MSDSLDPAAVAAIDESALLGDVLAIPDHIVDAAWRAESAFLEPTKARSLTVCGMGGSAIGADLAAALIGNRATGPVTTNRGYSLPSWIGAEDAVVLSSYSGSTEETLACFEQAQASGAKLYVVSSGGPISEAAHAAGIPLIGLPGIFQPRAAVGYGVVSVIEIAIATGLAPTELRSELAAAAEALKGHAAGWAPDGDDPLAKELARMIYGRIPLIYGADLTAPVAYRWKGQINENAKFPAFSASLPEANHNEICAWDGAHELAACAAIFLADGDQHERVGKRIGLTAEIAAAHQASTRIVELPGETRADRLFAAVVLGDLVSIYLATLRGVDPTPVALIEELKDNLGRPAGTA